MKYKVTYEYRGTVTVDVDAKDEKEAEDKAMDQTDELIIGCLTVYDVQVRAA